VYVFGGADRVQRHFGELHRLDLGKLEAASFTFVQTDQPLLHFRDPRVGRGFRKLIPHGFHMIVSTPHDGSCLPGSLRGEKGGSMRAEWT
jgi:hypothetical protein